MNRVAALTPEKIAFFRLVDVCIATLRMGMSVAAKKSWLGKMKPSQAQIGFCYGFAEEMVDRKLGVDDFNRAAFVQLVFQQLFGERDGDKYIRQLLANEDAYLGGLTLGNTRYVEWDERGRPPLPPLD